MTWRQLSSLIVVLLAVVWVTAAHAVPLETLERLQLEHPSSAGAEALANAYLDADRPAEAVAILREQAVRQPASRLRLSGLLGRGLYELGNDSTARNALEQAVDADQNDENARIYLALVLWRLGEADQANAILAAAGERSDELRAATEIARGLIAVEAGDLERAREYLGTAPPRSPSRFSFELRSGIEIDSNVLLDSGDLPGTSTGSSDTRFRYGATVGWQTQPASNLFVQTAYRFDRTRHDDLSLFDLETHQGLIQARWFVGERVAFEVAGGGAHHRLHNASYLSQGNARVALLVDLRSPSGSSLGVARLGVSGETLSFHEDPILPSLERDGTRYVASLHHHFALPLGERTRIFWGVSQGYRDADGTRDLFRLGSAYDHRFSALSLGIQAMLPWESQVTLQISAGREDYDHRNVIDLLTDDGVGNFTPVRRGDTVIESRLAIDHALTHWASIEFFVNRTHRLSNVDLYDYERTVGGLLIRFQVDDVAWQKTEENVR
jgi:tetratricopeptide (TPR) repeat protein